MEYRDILIQEVVEYILNHAETDSMLGRARDKALILAEEINSEITTKVLTEFKRRNGNGKEKS